MALGPPTERPAPSAHAGLAHRERTWIRVKSGQGKASEGAPRVPLGVRPGAGRRFLSLRSSPSLGPPRGAPWVHPSSATTTRTLRSLRQSVPSLGILPRAGQLCCHLPACSGQRGRR